MIIAGYWSKRQETLQSSSSQLADFLSALSKRGHPFSKWYPKGLRPRTAEHLTLDSSSLARHLRPNLRDSDRSAILELGHSFSVWNGQDFSLSATLGAWHEKVMNCVVLNLGLRQALALDDCRDILAMLVRAFNPEHGVVTTSSILNNQKRGDQPWLNGLVTYHRGGTEDRTNT
jgi:hypothetical protein